MQEFWDDFYKISRIPRCTFETDKMRDFLLEFASSQGFSASVDKAGNIYAFKGEPKICLQAHYDMVCVGLAPSIEIVNDGEFLSAKNSSLGADDGIGVVIAMEMMREFDDIEVLWTNNEESGLMGASSCEFKTKSKKLLNLDSEDENELCIGCAGGVDIAVRREFKSVEKSGNFYEISLCGLPGGHSGVEIAKNIPNAIKILAKFISENEGEIVSINGGERHNSIPVNAKCVAKFDDIQSGEISQNGANLSIKKLDFDKAKVFEDSGILLGLINAFHQGVWEYDEMVCTPKTSINLSIIKTEKNLVSIDFFARSASEKSLEDIKFSVENLAKLCGFETKFANQSKPWEPKISDFNTKIFEMIKRFNPKITPKAIHAGLECGVLCTLDESLEAVSIGPNIISPHTTHEKVEIKSAQNCLNIVREIIKNI